MILENKLVDPIQQDLASMVTSACSQCRFHVLITLTVQRQMPDGSVMRSKLSFVDLADTSIGMILLSMAKTWEHILHDHLGNRH